MAKQDKQTLDGMMGDVPAGDAPDLDTPVSSSRPMYDTTRKFGADEVSTPILKMAQGLSPEVRDREAQPGDFILQGFDAQESVTLVIVGYSQARRFVPKDAQRAACWASAPTAELLVGLGEFKGRPCMECPLSQWTQEGERNVPPPCNEIDDWLCFSVTHGMPVRYPLKGMAMKSSRFLKQLCNGLGMGNFAVEVTSKSQSRNGRTWQEPEIKLSNTVSPEQAAQYASIARGAADTAALPETAEA